MKGKLRVLSPDVHDVDVVKQLHLISGINSKLPKISNSLFKINDVIS